MHIYLQEQKGQVKHLPAKILLEQLIVCRVKTKSLVMNVKYVRI